MPQQPGKEPRDMDDFNEGGQSSDQIDSTVARSVKKRDQTFGWDEDAEGTADEFESSPEHLLDRIIELEAGAFSAEQKERLLKMLTEYTNALYNKRLDSRLRTVEDALKKAGLMPRD